MCRLSGFSRHISEFAKKTGLATNDILSHDPFYNALYCTVFFVTSSFRVMRFDASGYKLFIFVMNTKTKMFCVVRSLLALYFTTQIFAFHFNPSSCNIIWLSSRKGSVLKR